MVMGPKSGLMDLSILVNGKMIKPTDREFYIMQMEIFMRVLG